MSYDKTLDIFKDKLGSAVYSPDIRPVLNQSDVIQVSVLFGIVSIVELNDVTQSFVCNGFFSFVWRDERVSWNPSDYGGQDLIHPLPVHTWRPRVILINTLDKRDVFDDDKAPMYVSSFGTTNWIPGSLISVSCQLDMTYYPFDDQTCYIKFQPMSLSTKEMVFKVASSDISTDYFTEHGEWDLKEKSIEVYNQTISRFSFSCLQMVLLKHA
ncbi:acetylcholine receptor subunit gamma-like [Physella acuta]|uniref:acetylcholine receptor subunit gamma-like n=1 Tax=Physella acuta TaxID=109671 RepID=UPI0027DB9F05|nr:acetylcholine receptor subunit gamma-like [Physella acuta]